MLVEASKSGDVAVNRIISEFVNKEFRHLPQKQASSIIEFAVGKIVSLK